MSTREEFSYFITCLRCGNQGELNVSEDDYPFMLNSNRAAEILRFATKRLAGNFFSGSSLSILSA